MQINFTIGSHFQIKNSVGQREKIETLTQSFRLHGHRQKWLDFACEIYFETVNVIGKYAEKNV